MDFMGASVYAYSRTGSRSRQSLVQVMKNLNPGLLILVAKQTWTCAVCLHGRSLVQKGRQRTWAGGWRRRKSEIQGSGCGHSWGSIWEQRNSQRCEGCWESGTTAKDGREEHGRGQRTCCKYALCRVSVEMNCFKNLNIKCAFYKTVLCVDLKILEWDSSATWICFSPMPSP